VQDGFLGAGCENLPVQHYRIRVRGGWGKTRDVGAILIERGGQAGLGRPESPAWWPQPRWIHGAPRPGSRCRFRRCGAGPPAQAKRCRSSLKEHASCGLFNDTVDFNRIAGQFTSPPMGAGHLLLEEVRQSTRLKPARFTTPESAQFRSTATAC
jgi:hypothetical protein